MPMLEEAQNSLQISGDNNKTVCTKVEKKTGMNSKHRMTEQTKSLFLETMMST
jgi:hypothetical protein